MKYSVQDAAGFATCGRLKYQAAMRHLEDAGRSPHSGAREAAAYAVATGNTHWAWSVVHVLAWLNELAPKSLWRVAHDAFNDRPEGVGWESYTSHWERAARAVEAEVLRRRGLEP